MEGVLLNALGEQAPNRLSPARRRLPCSLQAIDQRISFLQAHSIENSTRKGYRTGAKDYIKFCTQHSIPLDPTPQTLARYIAYTSQFIASAPKYLTGARHFLTDIYPNFDDNRKSAFVRTTIRGSIKVRGDPIHRKLSLRLSHLLTFHSIALHSSATYDDLLLSTILTVAFFACHRIGELVIPNDRSLFDWKKIIKRSSLNFLLKRASYILPYHKGDPLYHGTLIMHMDHDAINPVLLLYTYVHQRDLRHGARPALFIKEDGSLPTRSWFEQKFFSVLPRCDYGGHSARAGGATYYANLGLSEDVIQAIGRWSSISWKSYIRDNPTIRAELQLAALRRP
ncbi:unnamed protein product [Somion occarium]|uniref:Integrase n=1 Tax=Somion occarium TaxID=3059160 RepID=A0ABP1DLJ3_9APHY